MSPEQLKYLESHEWVYLEEKDGKQIATVGISAFAVEQLNDIVHMELPTVGQSVSAGEEFGEVESVKAVSSMYSPVSGTIVDVHADLPDNLEILNDDPYQKGWILRIETSAVSEHLLDYAAYQKQCEESH